MDLKLENNRLNFWIENTAFENEEAKENKGIGLENVVKRLELYYRDNYELVKEHKNDKFFVRLTIKNLNAMAND